MRVRDRDMDGTFLTMSHIWKYECHIMPYNHFDIIHGHGHLCSSLSTVFDSLLLFFSCCGWTEAVLDVGLALSGDAVARSHYRLHSQHRLNTIWMSYIFFTQKYSLRSGFVLIRRCYFLSKWKQWHLTLSSFSVRWRNENSTNWRQTRLVCLFDWKLFPFCLLFL